MMWKLDTRVILVLIVVTTTTYNLYNYRTQHVMTYNHDSFKELLLRLRLDEIKNVTKKCLVWKSEKTLRFIQKHTRQSTHKLFHNQFDKEPLCHITSGYIFNSRPDIMLPDNCQETEIQHAISYALQCLNQNHVKDEQATFGTDTFVGGYYFGASPIGKHYDLYFKVILNNKTFTNTVRKLILSKPVNELHLISFEDMVDHDQKENIHIIIALQGKVIIFQRFIANFIQVVVKNDRHVNLTVVYFRSPRYEDIQSIVEMVKNEHNHEITLLFVNDTFSRGHGLHIGAGNCSKNKTQNPLLFFCDVDIIFTEYFLDHCRSNAVTNKHEYYPIIFSLYNPDKVYKSIDQALPLKLDHTILSDEAGFWREFGMGMLCSYSDDYFKTGGFNLSIKGWGGEDVDLYKNYVSRGYKVIRWADASIFHVWHDKSCDANLTKKQYSACLSSRKANEGPLIRSVRNT